MPESGFDVFLCHNSRDKPAVEETARTLRERGLRPWLDVWELLPGLPWQRALEAQIETIGAAEVFVGTEGRGPWQELELEAFLRQFSANQRFKASTRQALTTDAHLATLARQRGYVLYSTDTDFARFPGLRWVNPCSQR